MNTHHRLTLPVALVAATLAGLATAQAQTASSSAASSSSAGGGHATAKSSSHDGATASSSTDDKGCRVIRQSEAGRGVTSSVTTNPDGSLSGSTSAGSSGASASAGGGRASSDCVVVKPDHEVGNGKGGPGR